MENFIINAIIASVAIAVLTGPFGCFVVWKKISYFGDSLAHSVIFAVALSVTLNINLYLSLFLFSICYSSILVLSQKNYSMDSLLGIFSHGFLSLGLVITSLMETRIDLFALLFGDILAVSRIDIILLYCLALFSIIWFILKWKQLLMITINEDLAAVEGINSNLINFQFNFLLSLVICLSIQIVGIILVTSMLIIPPAIARYLSSNPKNMIIYSSFIAVASLLLGLINSMNFDIPTGPSIILVGFIGFILINTVFKLIKKDFSQ